MSERFEVVVRWADVPGRDGGRRSRQDGASRSIACNGVFPFGGLVGNTQFLDDAVARDGHGG